MFKVFVLDLFNLYSFTKTDEVTYITIYPCIKELGFKSSIFSRSNRNDCYYFKITDFYLIYFRSYYTQSLGYEINILNGGSVTLVIFSPASVRI